MGMYFSGFATRTGEGYEDSVRRLARELDAADAVLVGAGAGLSTSAGLTYSGERLARYFSDFVRKYHFADMYFGGFYPYASESEQWGFWSRYIWINRYAPIPSDTYGLLHDLVKDKDYFVLTTNVDHCFQRSGFDRGRLFYTQGDYGLWQCSEPCHDATYDNESVVRSMVLAQGFSIADDGALELPPGGLDACGRMVPERLAPRCPVCGRLMSMNLRADDTFVEDAGWRRAAARYQDFVRRHEGCRMLLLELGVGGNTPVIIKYPFWRMAASSRKATYACVNLGESFCPREIVGQSVLLDADITQVLRDVAREL